MRANTVSFVYYLVTIEPGFVMPINSFGLAKRNKWPFLFECERGAVACVERGQESGFMSRV